MSALEERMAKAEGILEQISARLNHLENRITGLENRIAGIEVTKADKWEMRIWFMMIMALLGAILGVVIGKL